MKRSLRRASALLRAYYAYMMEYRAEIILWALATVFPLIMMGVWMRFAAEGESVFSPQQYARYFLCVFMVRQFTVVWVIWEFEHHVVEGKLSPYLLQPMDPAWRFLSQHVAERVTRLPFTAAFVAVFFLLYPQALWLPAWPAAALAVVMTLVAFLLRFVMQYTSGMLAFWVERATAIEQFWWLFYLFLSGLVAPLDVYPPVVREIALFTPFPYLVWYPSHLLAFGGEYMGAFVSPVKAVLVVGGWFLGYFILNRWLWRKGLQQYSAMGA